MKSDVNLSAKNLKNYLWETLQKLKGNTIDINEVIAIAGISREIVRCANTQIKVAIYMEKNIPKDVIQFTED